MSDRTSDRDRAGEDSTGIDSVDGDSAGRDSVGGDSVGSDSVGRDSVGRDSVGGDSAGSDSVGKDSTDGDSDKVSVKVEIVEDESGESSARSPFSRSPFYGRDPREVFATWKVQYEKHFHAGRAGAGASGNDSHNDSANDSRNDSLAEDFRHRARSLAFPLAWTLLFVYLGGFFSTLLAVIAGGIAASEWRRLILVRRDQEQTSASTFFGEPEEQLITAGGFWVFLSLLLVPIFATSGIALALVWLVATLAAASIVERRVRVPALSARRLWIFALGAFYIGLALIAWVYLRGLTERGGFVFWILLVVWAGDSAAWLGGKKIGGLKLMPKVSPSKTWAGAISGLIGSVCVGVVLAPFALGLENSLANAERFAIWALLTGVVAQLGDLAESAVKRYARVKDSGQLLAGHGGFLDRTDSLLAAFVFWFLFTLILS